MRPHPLCFCTVYGDIANTPLTFEGLLFNLQGGGGGGEGVEARTCCKGPQFFFTFSLNGT